MTTTNFCYFLQGFLELSDPKEISAKDLQRIKGHLRLAFRDDIDPSMGSIEHQHALSAIHEREDWEEPQNNFFIDRKPGERC